MKDAYLGIKKKENKMGARFSVSRESLYCFTSPENPHAASALCGTACVALALYFVQCQGI